MYLIDSDIFIDYLWLHEPALEFLDQVKNKDVCMSFVSKFELLEGCQKKAKVARLERFIAEFKVLPLTEDVAENAFKIYQNIRWKSDIGMSDSMIAATAIQNKCTLVSRNIKHFNKIHGLKLKKPY